MMITNKLSFRTLVLALFLLYLFPFASAAQEAVRLPDRLWDWLSRYCYTVAGQFDPPYRDTLGFETLTQEKSWTEVRYRGDKEVARTFQRLRSTLSGDELRQSIAGVSICGLKSYPYRPEEIHVLRCPRIRATDEGLILVGESRSYAPWNDIVTPGYRLDIYWVGFDRSVELLGTFRVRTEYIPQGELFVLSDSLSYRYADPLGADTTAERTPPQFTGDEPRNLDGPHSRLRRYLSARIEYPEECREYGIQGKVALTLTIHPDRSVSDVRLLRGLDPPLDRPLLRAVLETGGMWDPGRVGDREVPVEVTLWIQFALNRTMEDPVLRVTATRR